MITIAIIAIVLIAQVIGYVAWQVVDRAISDCNARYDKAATRRVAGIERAYMGADRHGGSFRWDETATRLRSV